MRKLNHSTAGRSILGSPNARTHPCFPSFLPCLASVSIGLLIRILESRFWRLVIMSTTTVAATGATFHDGKKNVDQDVADYCDLVNSCESKANLEVKEDLKSKPESEVLSISLKEQLNLGKDDDERPRKSKEQVAEVAIEPVAKEVDDVKAETSKEEPAELQVLNLAVESPGRADNVVPIPFRPSTSKATLFTLKEGTKYRIIFNFVVSKSTVTGLKYIGDVWKKGIKVDHSKKPIGSCFSPREEAYVFELENGTTPSGMFARGSYSARARFVDGDGKCYLDTTYYFDIQKNWAVSSTSAS